MIPKLITTLPPLTEDQLEDTYGREQWISAVESAKRNNVCIQIIYNSIKDNKMVARNYKGQIYVRSHDRP